MTKIPVVNGLKECKTCHQWKPQSEFEKWRNDCKACRISKIIIARRKPEAKAKIKEWWQSSKGKAARKRARDKIKADPERYLKSIKLNQKRILKLKEEAIAYKGGKCSLCGYSKCTAALEFHHIDPKDKKFNDNGRSINKSASLEKNRAELDKCILVCVNCHREIHAGIVK